MLGEFLPLWASVSSSVKWVNLIPVLLCLAPEVDAGGNVAQDVTVSLVTFMTAERKVWGESEPKVLTRGPGFPRAPGNPGNPWLPWKRPRAGWGE